MTAGDRRTRQLALDLGHRPAFGREDFLVAKCNSDAVAWVDRWPDWPSPTLVIFGPPGCGKTHLAQVWRSRSGALSLDADNLGNRPARDTVGQARAVLLDPVGPAAFDEAALLHLHTALAERGGHLLITAETPPARWPLALADLASRLRAAPAVAIAPPDDALLGAVLVKLFADRQLGAPAEVIDYLLRRMERSFSAARAAVAAIDRAALAGRRPIGVALAREALGDGRPDTN